MSCSIKSALIGLTLSAAILPLTTQAAIINLEGTLSAANQNGSDPALVTDPNGVVDTEAKGVIKLQLDDEANTLNIQLGVTGITLDELRDFGPNASPIHLHNAGGGGANPGNFGPIAIDPTFTATETDFFGTPQGFAFERDGVSILLEDQGGVALGMHPGNDEIVDALLSGNMFVAVHTTNPLFTSPATDTRPEGFPFIEIRGNFKPVSAVPIPAALPLLASGLIGLFAVARRRA
ncbi:hypothetical protein MNBD_GAMMA13-342 [hydrothermal vent metagenome]|uniref:CHRD domain-containing protein n=1 Tax=hydrothermal vent metagenome TaxID=652676 RepID=A0A3B0Z2L5_9ZZZZ